MGVSPHATHSISEKKWPLLAASLLVQGQSYPFSKPLKQRLKEKEEGSLRGKQTTALTKLLNFDDTEKRWM